MAQRTVINVSLGAIIATVGTWALDTTSSLPNLKHTAADNTSVLFIPLNLPPEISIAPQNYQIAKVDFQYVIGTAALDAAPTAALARISTVETTGVRTRTAETTPTMSFVGTNTVGTAAGTYIGTATPAASLAHLENNEQFWLELTLNAAATTDLAIGFVRIWLAPAS